MEDRLLVTASPHIRDHSTTRGLMGNVVIALLPAVLASALIFGARALLLVVVTTFACVAFEYIYERLLHKPNTAGDLSAVVTGIILALNMPVGMPLWIAVVGAFVAIVITKQLFGGLGYNFANPAIVGRIALAMGFASRMSTYGFPADATSTATPLASSEGIDYVTLLLGNHGGVLGETCALTLLLGGLYLIATKVISPTIPVTYLATVAVLSLVSGRDPIYQLLSGGLILGAFFMATDYVTSPTTEKGKLVFGIGLGVITCLIRFFGTMNEGVSFAILLMNLLVPYIEILTRQDRLGIAKTKKKEGAAK